MRAVRQERPVLRVEHQGSTIDITPGQPWYVGIGTGCNVRLPIKGPAESWFVIRHAGVWTVRAVDTRTQLWLNGDLIPSDRSVRIGTSPEQVLHAARGACSVSLTISVPPSPTPAARAPDPAAVAQPSVGEPLPAATVGYPSTIPHPLAEPDPARAPAPASVPAPAPKAPAAESAPVVRQVEASSDRVERILRTPSDPTSQPILLPEPLAPSPADISTPAPVSAPVSRPAPTPEVITSPEQFLAIMRKHKWPGFVSLSGSLGKGIVLSRSITAGRRAAPLPLGDDGATPGEDGQTIYDLICPDGGRFPAGYLRDEGLVLTSNGRVYGWSLTLERDARVIDAAPAPLGKSLTRDFTPRDLRPDDLLPLLDQAYRRLLAP